MVHFTKLKRDERGMSVVEFGLLAPAFITFIIAIANLGIFFFAHSGVKSAVAEGARLASIHPRPTNEQILARIDGRHFGINPADITSRTVTDCTSDGTTSGRPCVDIQMSYLVKMNFVFFKSFSWSTYNLTERRRAFVYEPSLSRASPPATPTT
jgi:Flp pilus assembly protein TadG